MITTFRSDEIGTPRVSSKWLRWRSWIMPLTLLAVAFALQALASRNPHLVERYYSRGLFPPIIRALSLINGAVGFSIAELMIYVLVVLLVGTLTYQSREIYQRRKNAFGMLASDLRILI